MRRLAAVVAFSIAVLFIGSITVSFAEEPKSRKFSREEIKEMSETRAIIETTLGKIELKFFPKKAPNHVDNFITLAKEGFYDGTIFHRVIPGFMIQGGDPKSKSPNRAGHGTGGPGYTLKAEFNDISHKRGILSMARSRNPDSAGSQFFICVKDSPWLDGQYTVFGEVVSGMDVADRVVNQPKDGRDNPIERVEMKVKIKNMASGEEEETSAEVGEEAEEVSSEEETGAQADDASPEEGKED
jgi:peptidyl-prolyl cis-trans isomerase B (cyclophilin B)